VFFIHLSALIGAVLIDCGALQVRVLTDKAKTLLKRPACFRVRYSSSAVPPVLT